MENQTDLNKDMRQPDDAPRANGSAMYTETAAKPPIPYAAVSKKRSAPAPAPAAAPAAPAAPATAAAPHGAAAASRGRQAPVVSLENVERAPRIKGVLNSPRSLKACESEGIEPAELLPRPLEEFAGPNVPESLAQTRCTHFENRRKEKMQRARAARDKIPVEKKVEKEENGKTDEDTSGIKSEDQSKKTLPLHKLSFGTSLKSRHSVGTNGDVSMAFSRVSRGSSNPMRRSARARSPALSEMRSSRSYGNRSPSVGAMRIYESVMTEKRLPSFQEIDYLENNDEYELKTLGIQERVSLEQKMRERILIDKELKKSRRMLELMIEKEKKHNNTLRERQIGWKEKMDRIHEKQQREEAARREHIYSDIMKRRSMQNRESGLHSCSISPRVHSVSPDAKKS